MQPFSSYLDVAQIFLVLGLLIMFMLFGLYVMVGRNVALFGYILALFTLTSFFPDRVWAQQLAEALIKLGVPVIVAVVVCKSFLPKKK